MHLYFMCRDSITTTLANRCLLIVLLMSSLLAFSFQANSDKRIYSNFCITKIQLDGIATDWENRDFIVLKGDKVNSDNYVTIKSCWDSGSLYFFFEVKDKDLRASQTTQDDALLFLDDMVEVLFDSDNNKCSCWGEDDIVYHINLLGIKKDDRGTADCQSDASWDGCARYAVRLLGTLNDTTDIDEGYSIEFGIPWTELKLMPEGGLKLGINFANGDDDGKGRQLFDWVGAWLMRSPGAFGTLILGEEIK